MMTRAEIPPAVTLIGILSINLLLAALVCIYSGGASLAETWAELDRNSLVGLQALVEGRLDPNPEDPQLFFNVVLPFLESPAWLVVLVLLLVMDALPIMVLLRLIRRRRRELAKSVDRRE